MSNDKDVKRIAFFSHLRRKVLASLTALFGIFVLCLSPAGLAGQDAAESGASTAGPLLPREFSGWKLAGALRALATPQQADSTAAELLAEDGFVDGATASYVRADRKLAVKIARFKDSSGAYSAFTFYAQPSMTPASIGDGSGADGTHVLFFKANLLVDAVFDKVSAMSAAELRDLAANLPSLQGSEASLPVIQKYLPAQSYVPNSARYFFGPVGLSRINLDIPQQTVDFHRGAEVATGQYTTETGTGTLILLSYPTPQIAEERKKAFDALRQIPDLNFTRGPGFQVKRTGPILKITAGDFSSGEAQELLASVNYDANVTWNQDTFTGRHDNVGILIISVFELVGILLAFMFVVGIAFGGVRIVARKYFPGRIFGRPDEPEFITLHLEE